MALKKKTAAEALAKMQEGQDGQEPQAVAESNDPPAVAENAAVDQEAAPVTEDAPRLSVADLDVQPIAQDEDHPVGEAENIETHNFGWAARQVQNGLRVKREGWTGNKFIDVNHPSGKHVLMRDDMLATDWIVI